MKIIYTDALIVGGGLAGLRSAIAARDKGLDTIVISMVPVNVHTQRQRRVVCRQV